MQSTDYFEIDAEMIWLRLAAVHRTGKGSRLAVFVAVLCLLG